MTTCNLTAIQPHPSQHFNPFYMRSDEPSSSRKRAHSEIDHWDQIIASVNSKRNRCSLSEACKTNRLTSLQKIKITNFVLHKLRSTFEQLEGNGLSSLSTSEAAVFLPENIRIYFTPDNDLKIKFVDQAEYTPLEEAHFHNDPRSRMKDVYLVTNILNKILPNNRTINIFLETALAWDIDKDSIISIRKTLLTRSIEILEEQVSAVDKGNRAFEKNKETIVYRSDQPLNLELKVNCRYFFSNCHDLLPPRNKLMIINDLLQKIFYSPEGLLQREMLRYYPENLEVLYSRNRYVTIHYLPKIKKLPKHYYPEGAYSDVTIRSKANNLYAVGCVLRDFFSNLESESPSIREHIPTLIDDLTAADPTRIPAIFQKIQRIYFGKMLEDISEDCNWRGERSITSI